jgi:hypothetical protein
MRPSAHILRVIDVGSSVDLTAATRALHGKRGPDLLTAPGRRGGGASGVKLAMPPLDLDLGKQTVAGREVTLRVRLFEFGVASFRFELDLSGYTPAELIALAAEVEDDGGFDGAAREAWAALAPKLDRAVREPLVVDFVEDYAVFVLARDPDAGGGAPSPGETITRLLLGEADPQRLASEQIEAVRARAIRYFADDLVVVDYDAAVIVDPACGAELVDLFELATARLLELRYYDALLAKACEAIVVTTAARGSSARFWRRSPFAGAAERAATLLLELTQLTDRFERSITLLGDAHSVLVYQEAEARLRIAEAQRGVDEKLTSLARFAEVLGDQLHERRGLTLESVVVLLIAIELGLAFLRH